MSTIIKKSGQELDAAIGVGRKPARKVVWWDANGFTCANGEPSDWASTGSPRTAGSGNDQMLILEDVDGLTSFNAGYLYNTRDGKIDLSGCTNLTSINAYYGAVTNLNVKGCTGLTSLNCYTNSLTSLDVSGCTSLTNLSCSRNALTSLDVSGCTSLTSLNCYYNSLTSLDVSGLANLTSLNCNYNSLTSLDVSGCTSLRVLYCYSNSTFNSTITGIEDYDGDAVSAGRVDVGQCNLSQANIEAIAAALPAASGGTKTFDFDGNPGTSAAKATVISVATGKGWTCVPAS